MCKKIILLSACILSVFLSGCADTNRIDKASLAETVTVKKADNGIIYTFYLLSTDEEPEGVEILADSFEGAYALAKQKYIPSLSLAKLEMLVIDEKAYKETLKYDLEFLAENYLVTPDAYIILSDDSALDFIANEKDAPQMIENYIILQKNKNPDLQINLLSIFNNFSSDKPREFYISYINANKELKVSSTKISTEK